MHEPLLVSKQFTAVNIVRIRHMGCVQCIFTLVFMRHSNEMALPVMPSVLVGEALTVA